MKWPTIALCLLSGCAREIPPANDSYYSETQIIIQREATGEGLMAGLSNSLGISFVELNTMLHIGKSPALTQRLGKAWSELGACAGEMQISPNGKIDVAQARWIEGQRVLKFVDGTMLVRAGAFSENAECARLMANAVAEQFIELLKETLVQGALAETTFEVLFDASAPEPVNKALKLGELENLRSIGRY